MSIRQGGCVVPLGAACKLSVQIATLNGNGPALLAPRHRRLVLGKLRQTCAWLFRGDLYGVIELCSEIDRSSQRPVPNTVQIDRRSGWLDVKFIPAPVSHRRGIVGIDER